MQQSLFTVLSFKTAFLTRLREKLLILCTSPCSNYTLELNIMHINLAYHTSRGPEVVQFFYQKFCLVERKKILANCLQLVGIWTKWTHGVCPRYLILMHLLGIHGHQHMFLSGKSQREVLHIRNILCNTDKMKYL